MKRWFSLRACWGPPLLVSDLGLGLGQGPLASWSAGVQDQLSGGEAHGVGRFPIPSVGVKTVHARLAAVEMSRRRVRKVC